MMKDSLRTLAARIGRKRDYDSPPLHLWHPALTGSIPIRIDAQGVWYHEGSEIKRAALVRLFASILRREEDGEYYLVTPAEKWRIEVERHALLVTDFDVRTVDGIAVLEATLNTGKRIQVSEQHPLFLDSAMAGVACLRLSHGLTALSARAAWYRLVELAVAQEGFAVLTSGEYEFRLPIA